MSITSVIKEHWTPEKKMTCLRANKIFKGIEDDTLQEISVNLTPRPYKTGEQIYKQDDEVTGIYLVSEGAVRMQKEAKNSDSIEMEYRTSGDCIGITSVMTGGKRIVCVEAMNDCVVYHLSTEVFKGLVNNHSCIMRNITGELYVRISNLHFLVELFWQKSRKERKMEKSSPIQDARVAFFLHRRAESILLKERSKSDSVTIKISGRQLAALSKLDTSIVSHALTHLSEQHLINKASKFAPIEIISVSRLRAKVIEILESAPMVATD